MHTAVLTTPAPAATSVSGVAKVGRVRIFSGRTQTVCWPSTAGPQPNAGFGVSITAVGGPNPDGAPDIAVVAPHQQVGTNVSQGEVWSSAVPAGRLRYSGADPSPKFCWAP